jgi:hypothetical protein
MSAQIVFFWHSYSLAAEEANNFITHYTKNDHFPILLEIHGPQL